MLFKLQSVAFAKIVLARRDSDNLTVNSNMHLVNLQLA